MTTLSAPQTPIQPAIDRYQVRCDELHEQIVSSEAISRNYSWLRGLFFFSPFILGFLTLTEKIPMTIGWPLVGLTAFGFFVVVFIHENAVRRLESIRVRHLINRENILRLNREFDKADFFKVDNDSKFDYITADLDLFGRSSLFQLCCLARTPVGRKRLADWFLYPAEIPEIVERQKAIAELAPQDSIREELQLKGTLLKTSKAGPENLVNWAEGPFWLQPKMWLFYLAIALNFVFIGSFVLLFLGVFSKTVAGSILLLAIVANTVYTLFTSGSIHIIFRQVADRATEVGHYVDLFDLTQKVEGDSKLVNEIRTTLADGSKAASSEMSRLEWIMSFATMRNSGLLWVVYLALQFFLLFDVHCLFWLEKWQARCRGSVGKWFTSIANWEALTSLAQIQHDHPHWVVPAFVESGQPKVITAKELGHPLISETERVLNDVQVGPTGSILLVTGSNMSGKSTLLRSVGINVVLAQAGCAVCATEFSLPSLQIETSMRISDSLASGVSFFMAELNRLKEIVDSSRAFASNEKSSRTLLYLLDEILQGTNSQERHIAVQRVIKHLMDSGAIGAISTHDLELANASGIKECCVPVHFRESFEDGQMTFDYELRQGVSTTTNALKLLELVGLKEKL